MNKISTERKLSCMLFGCPMVEDMKSCSISNLRILTLSQPFFVEEILEKSATEIFISVKYLCIVNKK
jgi:hypothetical protein